MKNAGFSSMVVVAAVACMAIGSALARPRNTGKAAKRRGGPSLGWLPDSARARLRTDRGKGTQGPVLQGGTLEGSVVRGWIDSNPDRGTATPSNPTAAPDIRRFVGLRRGERPVEVLVTGTTADPCRSGPAAVTLYELRVDGRNPCRDESLVPDGQEGALGACEREHLADYRGKAIAVHGGWGESMEYVATSRTQAFSTFSCLSGVVAKCVRLGYHLWDEGTAVELFESCVRASRADYCGTGMSFTCPGTVVDYVDKSGIQTRDANPAGEALEADWTPEGASCLNTARLSGCGHPADMDRLLQAIREECADNKHPIRIGGCSESCTGSDGSTCSSPLRTWMIQGQTNLCALTQEYCPAAAP